MADGVHEVRLAQPNARVEEEGVVRVARALGDGVGRRVREVVGLADDVCGEGVLGIEHRGGRARARGSLLPRRIHLRRDANDIAHRLARCLHERGLDELVVVVAQHVADELDVYKQGQDLPVEGNGNDVLEPGVIRDAVDLGLDELGSLVPNLLCARVFHRFSS